MMLLPKPSQDPVWWLPTRETSPKVGVVGEGRECVKTEGANLDGVSVGSLWNGLDVVPNALAERIVGAPPKVELDNLIRRAQQDAKSKRGKSLKESQDQAVTEGCKQALDTLSARLQNPNETWNSLQYFGEAACQNLFAQPCDWNFRISPTWGTESQPTAFPHDLFAMPDWGSGALLDPAAFLGSWVDLQGNSVHVYSTKTKLVAALSRPQLAETHLTIRQQGGSWFCGNAMLDPWGSSESQLLWISAIGHQSVWSRGHE